MLVTLTSFPLGAMVTADPEKDADRLVGFFAGGLDPIVAGLDVARFARLIRRGEFFAAGSVAAEYGLSFAVCKGVPDGSHGSL